MQMYLANIILKAELKFPTLANFAFVTHFDLSTYVIVLETELKIQHLPPLLLLFILTFRSIYVIVQFEHDNNIHTLLEFYVAGESEWAEFESVAFDDTAAGYRCGNSVD